MNERADHRQMRGDHWLLGLVVLLAGLAYRELVVWDSAPQIPANVTGWFYNPSDSSAQLLFVLVIGLFYLRRKDIATAFQGNGAPWSAVLFLVPGICLYLWGRYIGITDVVYLSFLLVGFGALRLLSGKHLTRAILPPALILVLAIPLPAVLINKIIFPLQLFTAEHSALLLNIMGMPALAEGDIIIMAGNSAWVAESCTALGFVKWLTIFALAYVYIFRVPRWHALVLVLSAPVIAYTVNLLRAFSLILNPKAEILSLHAVQGVIFFLIGFFLLYLLDSLLLRIYKHRKRSAAEQQTMAPRGAGTGGKHRQLLLLAGLFTVLLAVSLGLPRWSAPPARAAGEINLPEVMGSWKMAGNASPNFLFFGTVRYTSHLYRDYKRKNDLVSVFIGFDDRWRRWRSIISDKNAHQDEVGMVRERARFDLGVANRQAVSVLTDTDHGRILTWQWYIGVESTPVEILRALLALDHSPLQRPRGAFVIRLATNAPPRPGGRAEADRRLNDFLHVLGNTALDGSGLLPEVAQDQ